MCYSSQEDTPLKVKDAATHINLLRGYTNERTNDSNYRESALKSTRTFTFSLQTKNISNIFGLKYEHTHVCSLNTQDWPQATCYTTKF